VGFEAAAKFDAFPPLLCFRLRIAPVSALLRRGKSPRQAGATSLPAILDKVFTRLRFTSAFVELRRDKPTRRAGEL